MRKASILCQCESVVLTLWLAIAGPSNHVHTSMSDMAIEGEQHMDTDLEEEISIGTECYMLLLHQDPSSSSKDCEEDEKESDRGTWQTRSKRNVCAALPFTGPSPRVPVSNIVRSPPPPNYLSFFPFQICWNQQVLSSVLCCKKWRQLSSSGRNVLLSCFSSKNEPWPAWCIETVLV
jgi:hypothetical protein